MLFVACIKFLDLTSSSHFPELVGAKCDDNFYRFHNSARVNSLTLTLKRVFVCCCRRSWVFSANFAKDKIKGIFCFLNIKELDLCHFTNIIVSFLILEQIVIQFADYIEVTADLHSKLTN